MFIDEGTKGISGPSRQGESSRNKYLLPREHRERSTEWKAAVVYAHLYHIAGF